MEKNALQVYNESIGTKFLEDISPCFSIETNGNLKLFIAGVNAIPHHGHGDGNPLLGLEHFKINRIIRLQFGAVRVTSIELT